MEKGQTSGGWLNRLAGMTGQVFGGRRRRADLAVGGMIFNIQRFSIHDGPGIRTTVFFKGCPLHCRWCSNPESMNLHPEIVTRFETLCRHCDRCLEVCPTGAIQVIDDVNNNDGPTRRLRRLDRDRCDNCLQCLDACPTGALSLAGEEKSVEDILTVVEKDRPFYRTSSGGLTLSGGEPLMQPEFARALLRQAKHRGLHTALDTSGQAAKETIEAVLPYLDLVLYDIKHPDPEKHRRFTGADNARILDNLRFLTGKVPLWLRVPLIPGHNDDESTLNQIITLAGTVPGARLFFLPYHKWGSGKYSGLGREYPLAGTDPVSPETLECIVSLCAAAGLIDYEIAAE